MPEPATIHTPVLILIETSTQLCSAALSAGDRIISYRESSDPKAHASKLCVFIDEMLKEQGMKVSDCNAVAVSKGPGSYTGLRVGVSTAKGLCFGGNIPLIAVSTLEILAHQAHSESLIPQGCIAIVPMIDARRMEVYCSRFDTQCHETAQVEARIIDKDSFSDLLAAQNGKVLFIGDGADKCRETLASDNAVFTQCWPKASSMLTPALERFARGEFEQIAYFEPFYLKEFAITPSKKKLL